MNTRPRWSRPPLRILAPGLGLVAGCLLPATALRAGIGDDLVVHLPFDGALNDVSGRGNHGTAVGTPQFLAGQVGTHAVTLSSRKDGSAFRYVTLGTPSDLNFGIATDFSVSFWAKFSTWTFDPPFVGNKDWLSGNNQGWMIATGTDGRLQWNFGGAPGLRKDYDGPAATVSNGAWHHVAVTFLRAGEVITYLDGREVDVRDVTASLNNIDTPPGLATNLGQDGTGRYTDGGSVGVEDLMMDDVGLWRRVLTSNEVAAIHLAGLSGKDLATVVSTPEAPRLPNPPAPKSAVAGDPVSFKALPRGTSPFLFEWRRNGEAVPGGTNAILTLSNVQAADAGDYAVLIRNAAGELLAEPVSLTVDASQPPTLVESPLSQGAAQGGSARFKVVARGAEPLRYQWQRNGVDLPGATDAVLSFSRVQPADVGSYRVVVTAGNGQSAASTPASLTVIDDVRQDLVAHLTFDADFQDTSGRNHHGTPQGEPTLVEGKVGGKALRFTTKADGSSIHYLTLGSPADLDFGTDADYSFSFWLKFSRWTRDPVLLANKSWFSSGSLIGYALAIGSDGRFQWNFKEQVGERADYDSPPGVISDGQWHHLAVAFQRGGQAVTWIDGEQVDARPLPASGTVIEPGLPLNVGQDGTGEYTENGNAGIDDGTLDDLAIWRRAITGEEVLTIYRKGALFGANVQQPAITDSLIVHLPFDGDFQDRSGRGNHGQAMGTPGFTAGLVGTQALSYSSRKEGNSFNYVTLGSVPDLQFGADLDYSVSFWTRFTTWTGDPAFIGNKDWSSGGNQGWVIATAGNGRLQWNLGDGDAGARTRKDYDGPAGTFGDGRWHHVVVTFGRQSMGRSYIDGEQVNETSLIPDLDSIDTPAGLATNIGQDGKGSYTDNGAVGMTDGQLDDVAIWRRVLLPAEVAALYGQGLQGINVMGQTPPPVLEIVRNGLALTLTWPNSVTGFVLESSGALGAAANWTPMAGVNGTSATVSPEGATRYFRLRKP
jgi:hypothetical protein